MSEFVKIRVDAVDALVEEASRSTKDYIYKLLSYEVSRDEYRNGEYIKHPPDVYSFFDYAEGTFPAGFSSAVCGGLKKRGCELLVDKVKPPLPLGDEYPSVSGFVDHPRYKYQRETVDELMRRGRMIAQLAVGAGKSLTAVYATLRLGRPTLFLTTRELLMRQMKGWFERAGLEVGILGSGEWNPSAVVNCGMVQTFASYLKSADKRDEALAVLQNTEFVIGEEAHESGAATYYDVLRHCTNAHYRLALTATPFMRDEREANLRLMASFGPVGIRVDEKTLIDRGILATPKFKYVTSEYAKDVHYKSQWQTAVKRGIAENADRNRLIVAEVKKAVQHGLSVIVLVQLQKHGVLLHKALRAAGMNVDYIFGETHSLKRQTALNNIRDGRIDVLIGSTILDVGVDVPAIGMIVLAGGGKAEVGLRQRIGRGLRAKVNGPNVCYIVDFYDRFNKILARHSLMRRQIVENTPGFGENILSFGTDFDYSIFD